jgi:hypothetical protein
MIRSLIVIALLEIFACLSLFAAIDYPHSDTPLEGTIITTITKNISIVSVDYSGELLKGPYRMMDSDGTEYFIGWHDIQTYNQARNKIGYNSTITYREYFNIYGILARKIVTMYNFESPLGMECCTMCCCQGNVNKNMCVI